jgi:FolB domain-containing protein
MFNDWMKFKGLSYDVHIGCFEPERSVKQNLSLEFDALVTSIDRAHVDDPDHIVLDYAVVTKMLQDYFSKNEFRLLETAAEGVANLLLTRFNVQKVVVSLTKCPKDMPKNSSVTYVCERQNSSAK